MPLRDHIQGQRNRRSSLFTPSTVKLALLGLVLAILIFGGVILDHMGQKTLIRTDATTLCPLKGPPSEVTVILLDMSDEFSEPQRLKLRNELDRLKLRIPRFGLVEVYAVDRLGDRVTKPIVHLCNPGTGEDMSPYYQNPELARRRWTEFSDQLDQELARMMEEPESPTSPIFEAIQATALRTFNTSQHKNLRKHLIVVSDLMQNVPQKLSHYNAIPPFEDFKQSAYFSEVRTELDNVTVTLLYLVRPRTPQKWPEHYRFWEQYFLAQEATLDRLEPVYGAQ